MQKNNKNNKKNKSFHCPTSRNYLNDEISETSASDESDDGNNNNNNNNNNNININRGKNNNNNNNNNNNTNVNINDCGDKGNGKTQQFCVHMIKMPLKHLLYNFGVLFFLIDY